jgi:hypothetical protein
VSEEFLKVAYADADPQVRAATLVVFATDPRQPEVTRALESDDAFERTVAEAVVSRFDRERARVADRLRMGGPPQSGPMTEPPGSPGSPTGR